MLTKMKMAVVLVGSLLVGGIGIAAAQGVGSSAPDQQQRTEWKAKRAEKKAEMLAKYDINKDGKLDKTERAVMINDKAEAAFKKADTNGDGQISMSEFKAFKQGQHRHGRGGHFRHRGGPDGIKTGGNGAGQP